MVNVRFVSRLKNPVTLAWVKKLAGSAGPPEGVSYIGADGLKAIKDMPLVNRGRLSVQPVGDEAYAAIVAMGEKGGMDELPAAKKGNVKRVKEEDEEKAEPGNGKVKSEPKAKKAKTEPKAKAEPKPKKEPPPAPEGTRRSSRLRK